MLHLLVVIIIIKWVRKKMCTLNIPVRFKTLKKLKFYKITSVIPIESKRREEIKLHRNVNIYDDTF